MDCYGGIDQFYCWDFDEKFAGEIEKLETDIVLYAEEFEFDYETGERKILYKEHITIEKTFQNN